MAAYSAIIPAVLVKSQKLVQSARDDSDVAALAVVADYVKLPKDTSSCFILYPELPQQPGQVLGCEVSTFEVDDSGKETNMVLQTIADRKFTNVCKLISGYSKTLKIFTASVPCTSGDSGFDVELDSLNTRIYCRSRCIKNKELWSPSVDYVPGNTIWNGGPCQMVCRKGDYGKVQMMYYDYISEIQPGVYLFELTDKSAGVDIIWNTLPVEKKIDDHGWGYLNNLVVQPVSYAIVPSYSWVDIFPVLRLVDEEHFKSRDKRAMSLANYYLNDAMDARNKLIQARIQNEQLRRVNELTVGEYRAISDTANSTVERLYKMFTNLSERHRRETEDGEPSRKRSRENSDNEADDDDECGNLEIVEMDDETRQPESLPAQDVNGEIEVDGEKRSFPSEVFFKPNSKNVRFQDDA